MKGFELSSQELSSLRIAHRRTKEKRLADRIKAIYLLGKGRTLSDVSEVLMLDEDTLRRYVNKYQSGGVKLLLTDDFQGNEGRLTDLELKILDDHLMEVTYRTVKEIIAYVEEEFGEKYTVSGMTKLLHRLSYSYKKPKRVPGKADEQLQRSFIRKYREIKREMNLNDSIYFMDGVHPHHNPLAMYGWIKKGTEKELRTNTRYQRLNINGAINIKNLQLVTRFEGSLTEEATLDFLEDLRKAQRIGNIYLICDRARYYETDRVKAYAKSMAIKMIYLPPYSPNLNVIERLWQYFQKKVLYNHYYPTFEEFKQACKVFFADLRPYRNELSSLLTDNFQIIRT
jgi:transposase